MTPGNGRSHCLAHLLEYAQVFCLIFVAHPVGSRRQSFEGFAFHELHRDERTAVRQPPYIVNRRDPGVLELSADLSFLNEPANETEIALQRVCAGFLPRPRGATPYPRP